MENTKPSFSSYNPTEQQIHVLFEEYKTDAYLAVLLHEAEVDTSEFQNNEEVLDKLVTKLFQKMMKWRPSQDIDETFKGQLKVSFLRGFFETNNTYANLTRIFAQHVNMPQFNAQAQTVGFEGSGEMMMFFVTYAGLEKVNGNNNKPVVSWTLIQHCKNSKSTQISLRGCALQQFPQFQHVASVTYLDLEWNALTTADLLSYTQLIDLNLAHNLLTAIPVNLPDCLCELNLSGNPIASLDFEKLPKELGMLNISYMANTKIPDSFWQLLSGRQMILQISSDMMLKPPENVDLNKIMFIDQFGGPGTIQNGTVVFESEKELSPAVSLTCSTRSNDDEEDDTSGGFMKTALGWLSITAIVAGISYIFMKLWQRYKNA